MSTRVPIVKWSSLFNVWRKESNEIKFSYKAACYGWQHWGANLTCWFRRGFGAYLRRAAPSKQSAWWTNIVIEGVREEEAEEERSRRERQCKTLGGGLHFMTAAARAHPSELWEYLVHGGVHFQKGCPHSWRTPNNGFFETRVAKRGSSNLSSYLSQVALYNASLHN